MTTEAETRRLITDFLNAFTQHAEHVLLPDDGPALINSIALPDYLEWRKKDPIVDPKRADDLAKAVKELEILLEVDAKEEMA